MKNCGLKITFVLFAGIVSTTFGNDFGACCYVFEKAYCISISRHALSKTPKWSKDEENPPLSARKAIKLADALRIKLVQSDEDWEWHRSEASLIFQDNDSFCYWRITYEANVRRGGSSGPPITLDIYVMMDGTVIEPVVSDRK